MKTKRYFKLLLKPYRIMLKEFDQDIRVSIGPKFCCFPQLEEKEIEIPVMENEKGKNAFYNKMNRKLEEYQIQENFSSEILSFLHEIGHIYTYSKFYEFTYKIGTTLIAKIQYVFRSPKLLNFFYNCYFNLKLEKLADKWAMNFIKEHTELIKQWDLMLMQNYSKVLPKFVDHMKIKYHTDLLA